MQKRSKHNDHNDHSDFDGFDIAKIEENFKTLASELKTKKGSFSRFDGEVEEIREDKTPYFQAYVPSILDYLARADSVDDCLDIIKFCLSRNEITNQEAEKLQKRLELGGPRAFGTRKPGYYDAKLY